MPSSSPDQAIYKIQFETAGIGRMVRREFGLITKSNRPAELEGLNLVNYLTIGSRIRISIMKVQL